MAKKNNTLNKICFDNEKLEMIKFWVNHKNEDIDVEQLISDCVNKEIERLYIKKVPKDVRIFLDSKKSTKKTELQQEVLDNENN